MDSMAVGSRCESCTNTAASSQRQMEAMSGLHAQTAADARRKNGVEWSGVEWSGVEWCSRGDSGWREAVRLRSGSSSGMSVRSLLAWQLS